MEDRSVYCDCADVGAHLLTFVDADSVEPEFDAVYVVAGDWRRSGFGWFLF